MALRSDPDRLILPDEILAKYARMNAFFMAFISKVKVQQQRVLLRGHTRHQAHLRACVYRCCCLVFSQNLPAYDWQLGQLNYIEKRFDLPPTLRDVSSGVRHASFNTLLFVFFASSCPSFVVSFRMRRQCSLTVRLSKTASVC